MEKLALFATAAVIAVTAWFAAPPPQPAHAMTCFKTGEYVSGMNKICLYNCLGSEAAITIRSTQLCPLSIQR